MLLLEKIARRRAIFFCFHRVESRETGVSGMVNFLIECNKDALDN
jgi:hypothetical protein